MRELKIFLIAMIISICSVFLSNADTITLKWLNDGGTSVSSTTTCESGGDVILPNAPTKYGYTFQGWKIKNKYTLVEYLESTGAQWIDTGITAGSITQMYIKASLVKPTSGATIYIFGAQQNQIKVYFFLNTNSAGFIGAGSIPFDNNTSIFELNAYINSQNEWVLSDGNNTSIGSSVFEQPSLKIWLFGNNYNNTLDRTAALKIYNAKIYDNNSLVRDFIPVLDSNGVPCMFDKVTRQFFYNQSTGNFIAGPEISE